jgi:hypothetical protein
MFFLFPLAIVAAASLQWFAASVDAHHSEAPFYDSDKTVNIRGVVKSWVFRNPHPFLYVEVADDKGVKNDWVLEFVGPVRLIKQGWSAKTFTPGEIVSATGHPSRQPGTFGLSPLSVSRADGSVIPGSGRSGGLTPENSGGRGPGGGPGGGRGENN